MLMGMAALELAPGLFPCSLLGSSTQFPMAWESWREYCKTLASVGRNLRHVLKVELLTSTCPMPTSEKACLTILIAMVCAMGFGSHLLVGMRLVLLRAGTAKLGVPIFAETSMRKMNAVGRKDGHGTAHS